MNYFNTLTEPQKFCKFWFLKSILRFSSMLKYCFTTTKVLTNVIQITIKTNKSLQAQLHLESQYFPTPVRTHSSAPLYPSALPYPVAPPSMPHPSAHVYPSLSDYMGLDLTPEVIAANMPEYVATVAIQPPVSSLLYIVSLRGL